MDKTVTVSVVCDVMLHVSFLPVPDVDMTRIVRMVRNEVRDVQQVALIHCIVLLLSLINTFVSGFLEPIPAFKAFGWPWVLADQLRVKSDFVGYTVEFRRS